MSFQEYLTAKAIAQLWISESDGIDAVKILIPRINGGHWIEIIPMVAVLLGRQAKPLIEHLINVSLPNNLEKEGERANLASLCLANCFGILKKKDLAFLMRIGK